MFDGTITIAECPYCKQVIPPRHALPGVDYVNRTIGGERVTPLGWLLFNTLADRFGRDVSRDFIIEILWGGKEDGGPEDARMELRVQVCMLRQKLIRIGYTILPIRRVGYRLAKRST
jgi:DNA-binding response OmpR family regulator